MYVLSKLGRMPPKLKKKKKTNISTKQNKLNNPNWSEGRPVGYLEAWSRVELPSTKKKKIQLSVRAGIEPTTSECQVRGPKHSTSASIFIIVIYLLFNCVMYHEYTINILYHSMELNTVTNNINATYARRLMGKLGVISSNTERPSCILIGCCIFCCIIWKKTIKPLEYSCCACPLLDLIV